MRAGKSILLPFIDNFSTLSIEHFLCELISIESTLSTFAISIQQVRLMMKVHAFARESFGKVLKIKKEEGMFVYMSIEAEDSSFRVETCSILIAPSFCPF